MHSDAHGMSSMPRGSHGSPSKRPHCLTVKASGAHGIFMMHHGSHCKFYNVALLQMAADTHYNVTKKADA